MSRFFKAGSDSESETESSEDDELIQQRPSAAPVPSRTFQFSDDEEDSKRIVRSAKDKRFDDMTNIIKQMKNHKNIKDMANVLSDFESLVKASEKAKKVIQEEGVPRFLIRCLYDLEEFANECWEDKEWRKSISKNNSKSFTSLRQKLKKFIRERFEKEVADYRENPDQGDDDKKEETPAPEVESEEEEVEKPAPVPVKPKLPAPPVIKKPARKDDDDDDDSESDWGMSDDSVESESDDEPMEVGKLTAEFFLKKSDSGTARKEKKKKEPKKIKLLESDEEEGDWEEVRGGAPLIMERPKMFAKDQDITVDAVMKKLHEITAARGKKGTDRNEQIELVKELREIALTNNLGLGVDVKLYFNIIGAIFDYNPNTLTSMRNDVWESCLEYIKTLLIMLIDHPEVTVGEEIKEDDEKLHEAPFMIRACFLTLVEKMDEEFTKMLQGCDAHSTEYVERLKDESQVCDIIEKTLRYLEIKGKPMEIARIYLKRIEHLYFKFDPSSVYTGESDLKLKEGSTEQIIDKLCKYLYTAETSDRLRTRAILCHIYHHALHNRWYQARDLMLMSHLQDNIGHSDIPTQLLYNRTLVQLGLCAFRQGNIRDAHNALVDIQSSNRAKELLAQGLLPNRQNERTPEQEKIEKRRLFPYHMHINLELLECVYLVSAMLLEIPFMAAHEMDVRRRMISKNFHHVMKMSERQTLIGPPESMREHVVAASKAMKTGDWKACKNFIVNDKMNAKVWDLFYQPDIVRDMIAVKIQEESLRTYLFTYSNVYDTLSLQTLADMFELTMPVVHRIISKMIINEELMASLAEPTQTVIMHRTEPSRLQSLALQLSDKFMTLVENNERILEVKQGIYPFQNKRDRNDRNQGGGAAFQHHAQGEGYGPAAGKQQNNQNWNRRNKNYNRDNRDNRHY